MSLLPSLLVYLSLDSCRTIRLVTPTVGILNEDRQNETFRKTEGEIFASVLRLLKTLVLERKRFIRQGYVPLAVLVRQGKG